jgi:NAD(P)-dependent dehydrogenase (short-subunit alcohol dehydrogenase family)
MFAWIAGHFGGIDILVHTASGGGPPDLFMNIDPADWRRTLDGKLISLMRCCRHAVPMMVARGGGAIVSVASDAARLATPGETVIGAAFAGNAMFTKTLAVELARHNIRANVVTPSITRDTKTYDAVMAGAFSRKLFLKAEQRARLGVPVPGDIAPIIVFLASPLASHITGQIGSRGRATPRLGHWFGTDPPVLAQPSGAVRACGGRSRDRGRHSASANPPWIKFESSTEQFLPRTLPGFAPPKPFG